MYNDEVVEEKNNSTGIIHGYVEEVTSIKYPFDICLYIDMLSRVSEGEQHKLIDKIWHEIDNFSFPKKVCGNRKESSCQKKWFNLQNDDDRKWLRYFVVDSIKSPMVRSSLTVTASTSTHGLKKRPSEKLSMKSHPRKCISVPPTRSFVKPKIINCQFRPVHLTIEVIHQRETSMILYQVCIMMK